jgi:hypothetical protein
MGMLGSAAKDQGKAKQQNAEQDTEALEAVILFPASFRYRSGEGARHSNLGNRWDKHRYSPAVSVRLYIKCFCGPESATSAELVGAIAFRRSSSSRTRFNP